MSSYGQFFTSGSPIMTLAPQPIHLTTAGLHHDFSAHHEFPIQLKQGRKRSRDEASVNLDSNTAETRPEIAMKPVKPSQIFYQSGSAMHIPQAYVASSGPSYTSNTEHRPTPTLRSHKSQRLDQSSLREKQTNPANISSVSLGGESTSQAPIVDDFTIHLGIGWRRISQDVDIQAAARGWARFIENQYPLSSVKICLESKGLQSYLVEANEGFFLFSENLKEGCLVSRTVEGALQNLKVSPPKFEGAKMIAGEQSSIRMPAVPDVDMAV